MKASNPTDRTEPAELSKLINRRKVADIRKYNIDRTEHALKNGGSLNAVKRKVAIGKNQMYALRGKHGSVTTNMDKIIQVAEDLYRGLYRSRNNRNDNGRGSSQEELDIPPVKKEEVSKALETMQRCKVAGQDHVTADRLKGGGQIVLEKLGTLYTQRLTTPTVSESWKNANIILIHKKGDARVLKNYRPISLLSVAYKLVTKVLCNRLRTILDFNQPRDQAGFRIGYSTIGHIRTINQMIEKCAEYKQPLYIAFMHYEKAFYSV